MLDRHVGPGAGVDNHVATGALEDGLEPRSLPGAHAHLLDNEVAGLRLKAGDRRRAPAAANHRLVVDDAFEQRRVERQARRAGLDDEPDMDDDDAARPRRGGEAAHVVDDALRAGVGGRAGGGEGAALTDDVVLQVLDDQGAAARIERQFLGDRRRRRRGSRARLRARGRRRRAAPPGAGHIGLGARPDLGGHPIDRMSRGEVERAEIRPAPGEIGDEFGDPHLSEEIA